MTLIFMDGWSMKKWLKFLAMKVFKILNHLVRT